MKTATGAIALLPQQVADAISAGEVVERPASVVKELCENSVDAGARHIAVSIDGGGTVRIRVADDGRGIAVSDLPLAVARHATSKIHGIADLDAITTLGFRGEALASIAAVSDFRITSSVIGGAAGRELHVRNGVQIGSSPAAPLPGTTVEVADLFAATPARLRFLRQAKAEAAAAVRLVGDLALCHPNVAFRCEIDGKQAMATPGSGSLRDAATAVFGRDAAHELLDVSGGGAITVSGLISEPRVHRGTRGGLVLVVNSRRVHNRALGFAAEEAYRGLLPQGRHPYGVVIVDIDAAEIDVNVHPTKREVRFREESRAFGAVQRACWEALQTAHVATLANPWGGAEPLHGDATLSQGELRVESPATAVGGALLFADSAPPRADEGGLLPVTTRAAATRPPTSSATSIPAMTATDINSNQVISIASWPTAPDHQVVGAASALG